VPIHLDHGLEVPPIYLFLCSWYRASLKYRVSK